MAVGPKPERPRSLQLDHPLLGPLGVKHHAWLRFCERYEETSGNNLSYQTTDYYEERLRSSVGRAYCPKISPGLEAYRIRKYGGGIAYLFDPEYNVSYVVSIPSAVVITVVIPQEFAAELGPRISFRRRRLPPGMRRRRRLAGRIRKRKEKEEERLLSKIRQQLDHLLAKSRKRRLAADRLAA